MNLKRQSIIYQKLLAAQSVLITTEKKSASLTTIIDHTFTVYEDNSVDYISFSNVDFDSYSNSNSNLLIEIYGRIISLNGEYYAVATDYQFPNQQKVPLPHRATTNSHLVTINTININDSYNYSAYYSIDEGQNWISISGSSFRFSDPDNSYLFKVIIRNAPGNQSQATLSLIDWQRISSPRDYVIPINGSIQLVNTISQVLTSNYAITIKAAVTP